MQPDVDRRRVARTRGRTAAKVSQRQRSADARGPAMRGIAVHLLGPFVVDGVDERGATLPKKAQALFAYLAVHAGRAFPREQLATLLWGDSGAEQARRSLRQCLVGLRAALGKGSDAVVVARGSDLMVTASAPLSLDVQRFEALADATTLNELESASELYRGEFLADLAAVSEPFSEWAAIERQRLAALMSDMLLRLARARADAGEVERAVAAAQRLTIIDPLREDGHRQLMQLLTSAGRRDSALKQYIACAELLRRELGIAPEPATKQLAEAIRNGTPVAAEGEVIARAQQPAQPEAHSHEASNNPPLPDKPSIAVLPFANLSGDTTQDYFADGIVEDISIALGRVHWLFVIAGSAAARYRGVSIDVRQVGTKLGVRYLLRGSIRKDGERIRIVVQLIDASHGRHIWAERFDSDSGDIFAVQDRLTNQVGAMIAPALQSVEIERAVRKPTESLTAYDLYLQALQRFRTSFEENQAALRLLYRAIELDPGYGAAYGLAARCYHLQTVFGWALPCDPSMQDGFRLARLAAEIGKRDSEALWMAGHTLAQVAGEIDYGLALIDRSLSLNPNSASAWVSSCFVRTFVEDTDTALAHFANAQRLNPLDSMHHIHWNAAAMAYFSAGRYDEAIEAAYRTLNERPTYPPALRLMLAVCGLTGRREEGQLYLRRLLDVNPDATVARLRALFSIPMQRRPRQLAAYLEGARRSGLPEGL